MVRASRWRAPTTAPLRTSAGSTTASWVRAKAPQAFGWVRTAQRFGIAQRVFEADVRRKGEKASIRARLTVCLLPTSRATFDQRRG